MKSKISDRIERNYRRHVPAGQPRYGVIIWRRKRAYRWDGKRWRAYRPTTVSPFIVSVNGEVISSNGGATMAFTA